MTFIQTSIIVIKTQKGDDIILHRKDYKADIIETIQALSELEDMLKLRLKHVPPGSLQSAGTAKHPYFYHHILSDEFDESVGKSVRKHTRKYLHKSEIDIVGKLAQKEYDQKLLKRVLQDKKSLSSLLKSYSGDLDSIFENLPLKKKPFVKPYRIPDSEYIKVWKETPFFPNPNYPDARKFTTIAGEQVRSKSEKSIADSLYRYKVPYKYECPFLLKNGTTIYPDFTILDIKKRRIILWEHLGMMDDSEYSSKQVKKMNQYYEEGIILGKQLLISMESGEDPLDQPVIDRMITEFLL